jgi:hypothetical protein
MSRVTCPKCGASWPLEKVAGRTSFGCGRCHTRVVVPAAPPAAAGQASGAAQPLETVEPLQVLEPLEVVEPVHDAEPPPPPRTPHPAHAAPQTHAPRPQAPQPHHPRPHAHGAHHHHAAPARTGVHPAVWIGAGVAVLGGVAAFVALSGGGDAAKQSAPAAAQAAAAKPDPMKDAAAWKALPEAERAAMAAHVVEATDASSEEALRRTADFLGERGEAASVESLAKRAVETNPGSRWANEKLGRADVTAEVDACLTQCELAEEHEDESYRALKAERATHAGLRWWASPDDAKRVRAAVAAVRQADQVIGTPYGAAVGHWARYQRSIEVMKDYPALHATTGPYIIFVALNVAGPEVEKLSPQERLARKATPEEEERGAKILERNRKLFTEFYEGWLREMGPRLGLTRYGPENCDDRTLLKANVFTKAEDFFRYNAKVDAGVGGFVRAYYSTEEPRFITTYDGGTDEPTIETDQVQCHEATHQLVHFYTWDLTRKDLGRDPDMLECAWRPLWSGEGFAEFFSTHRVVDGKYEWMQPLDERMRQLWIFGEIVKEKGWLPWRLSEFFSLQGGGALERLSASRSKNRDDDWIATGVMANLFYAKAWSFVYFLWYAEEGGKPKYRDRYVDYLKAEFHVKFRPAGDGKMHCDPVDGRDFMRIMGLSSEASLAAMEKEWTEFETKLVEANRKAAWDEERKKIRKNFEIDKKAAEPKEPPPKK